jgi:transposase
MHQGIAALLGLQSWIVYRVEPGEGAIEVFVGRPRKEARCPVCGARTRRVHDRARRWRRVLHTWSGHRPVYLRVRPRRFRWQNVHGGFPGDPALGAHHGLR